MLDKSSVCNILDEGMYFLEKSHQISPFWTFHCLSEVAQIFHVIFETRSQLLYKLCTILSYLSWSISVKCMYMEFSWSPSTKCKEYWTTLLFQRTLFLMFPHFQKYLNPQVRTNKLVNSVFYHPCPSRLASGIHPFIFL